MHFGQCPNFFCFFCFSFSSQYQAALIKSSAKASLINFNNQIMDAHQNFFNQNKKLHLKIKEEPKNYIWDSKPEETSHLKTAKTQAPIAL